ncbi:MAG: hypothetical protein CM1200mP12_00960 [Gammaproteobacteria bacterium]|nr:MAG: hypothetical protein CM1200mP12_00960 [Gammaproteobacteria bacterium]
MNKKFKECLLEVYLGEQAGEMIFESMLTMAEDDNQRYIFLGICFNLKKEGKAIMRPLLVKLGIPIEENKSLRNQGLEIAENFKGMSFKEQFENIYQSVKDYYLPQYEELSTLVDEEDSEACFIANFMGEHERSILLASENIIKDKPNPVQPIRDLLRFPI